MTQISIHDEVASDLTSAAASRGCSREDLASMLIMDGLHRDEVFQLSPEQEARLIESVEQTKRGELVDGEAVMARFDNALKAMAIR